MKRPVLLFAALVLLALGGGIARSATITWTNLAGGNWNDTNNWDLHQLPGAADTAILNISLAGSLTVPTNSVLNWTSGSVTGGLLTVSSNAVINWSGGDLSGGALTVAQGGMLTISNSVTLGFNAGNYTAVPNGGFLTNNGTVIWAAAGVYGYGGSVIYNAGIWQSVTDGALSSQFGTNTFTNAGALQKTGGTSTSTITWNVISTGTIDTPSGSLALDFSGASTLHGTANLSGGLINGSLSLASNSVVTWSSGTIGGAVNISSNAVMNWGGGDMSGGSLTVAQGGTLTVSNTVSFGFNAGNYTAVPNGSSLTNNGTVIWTANNGYGYGGGTTIYNAGLWQFTTDGSLSIQFGTNSFANAGNLQKTGGTGTSTVAWNFTSTGSINTASGSFTLNWSGPSTLHGNFTLSGTIAAPLTIVSGATMNWAGGDLSGGSLTVASGGTLTVSNTVSLGFNAGNYTAVPNGGFLTNNGTVIWAAANGYGYGGGTTIYNAGLWQSTTDGAISSQYGTNTFINAGTWQKTGGTGQSSLDWVFQNNGGTLDTSNGSFNFGNWNGNGTINGNGTLSGTINGIVASNAVMNWTGGDLSGRSVTVAPGGILTVSNTVTFGFNAGNYTAVPNGGFLTNNGTVIWAANNTYGYGGGSTIYNAGLWQLTTNGTISTQFGTNTFNNTGTLQKTGGTSTSAIDWSFLNNGGILGSQTNTLSLAGNYDLTGGVLNVGINSLTDYGIINLSGSPAVLTGTLSANLNNGYVPATGSSFQVLTYGSEIGTFTNFLPPFAVAMQTNYGGTTFTLTVLNVRPTLAAVAGQTVDELTTLTVTNSATDPDIGQTLTFALVSAPGGMSINPATGTISWVPAQTQSPSTNTVLVSVTDNGTPLLSVSNSFNAIVREVNVAPTLPSISTQTVNELMLLAVTNTATNFNIHSTITGYTLISPPSNMVINASGVITWTPAQAQSPGTNIITAIVTNSNPYDLINPRLTSTNQFTIIVFAPTLAPIGNYTVNAGQTVAFTASAADNDPTRTLTFSLVSPPAGATVNGLSGLFNWRVPASFAGATNTIQARVTDNSTPNLSDTKSFTVVVNPLAPVVLTPLSYTNGQFKVQVSGTIGPDYVIVGSSNLMQWNDLFTNFAPTTPFQFTDTNNSLFTNRFYRIRLLP